MSSSDFCSYRVVKSRKFQQCFLCGQSIEPGVPHDYAVGMTWGDFWRVRQHLECTAVTVKEKWGSDDWETFDPCEFKRPMDAFDPCI